MTRMLSGLAYIFFVAAIFPGANAAQAADITVLADTNTQSDAPTSNYGSNGVIGVSSGRVGLIRFNPAAIAQASGSRATLKLKVVLTKNASNGVSVRLVQSAWGETTVTANTLPSISATPLAQATIVTANQGKVVSFDVSAALAGWRSNPSTNFGLAIVAATPTPNLQFGSRELGAGAVLTIEGGVTQDNDVTVAPSGGDYTNPLAAVQNALTGDHWCASPQIPTSYCTVHIASGIYVLSQTLVLPPELQVIGAERSETVLVAAKGVQTAVKSAAHALMDFSILNNQNTTATETAIGLELVPDPTQNSDDRTRTLQRLAITVSGAQVNTGMIVGPDREYQSFTAIDVKAFGGTQTVGIEGRVRASQPVIQSRIEASGASQINEGIRMAPAFAGKLHLQSSVVIALGGGSALGLILGDSQSDASHEVTGSTIVVQSSGAATGVTVAAVNVGLTMLDSQVSAFGGTSGTGISHSSQAASTMLDGVRVSASSTGISLGAPPNNLDSVILRSTVNAGLVALRVQGITRVEVTGSQFKAPTWFSGSVDGSLPVTISDSTLDGGAVYGMAPVTCARVYDRNYAFLPNSCPSP